MTSSTVGCLLRTPAFVDAHVHLSRTGLVLTGLDLSGSRSRHDVLHRLEAHARTNTGAMILGAGWDETDWPDPTLPTIEELDRAAPGRPVLLARVDGHSGLISSALLARAPELRDLPGWDGTGRVERQASTRARAAADELVTRSQRKAAIAAALDAAAAAGLGCVHEMAAPHINVEEDIALIRELAAERRQIDVVTYWGEHASTGGVERARELGCAGAAGDLDIDGALGSRTAALHEPYADQPDLSPHSGHLYLDAEAVAEHVVACTRAGLQAGFHCIGDAATAAAADGFRLAAKEVGVDAVARRRHRLEHVELIDPDDVATLAECGVVISAQPAFDAFWGGESGMYAKRLGPERALASNPLAAIRAAGLELAFGSDSPVTPFDPWGAVRAAVRHHDEAARLDSTTAVHAHTEGGRRAGREEPSDSFVEWEVAGGLDADGVPVLEPGTPLPRCVRTVVGGHTVHRDEASSRGTERTDA